MLSIVTGLPGAGKTLYLLSKILNEYRGRSIYVAGIPAIDHEYFGTRELKNPDKWFQLDEGSVVIIDEAQKVFPLRKAGSIVPQKCSEFETHRHRGFDVVLLTQDASTLDVHIRKLAGRHIHVVRLFGGKSASIYEYPNYEQKPVDRNIRKSAVSTKTWRYDKSVFDHYKSADLHTVKRKIPVKLLVLPLLGLAVLAAFVFAIKAMFSLVSGGEDEPGLLGAVTEMGSELVGQAAPDSAGWEYLHTARVPGMPWTAPRYDKAQTVRHYPIPHCVIYGITDENHAGTCKCYTQQITIMHVDTAICRQLAYEGFFDPAKADRRERTESAQRRDRAPDQFGVSKSPVWELSR